MGHGAARTLDTGSGPLKELDEGLSQRIAASLAKIDASNAVFKSAREDERDSQLTKMWNAKCKEIDEHLRMLSKVIIAAHQLSLEVGSQGGGRATSPFLEESNLTFKRFFIKLVDGKVHATFDGQILCVGEIDEVDYDWVEAAVVDWIELASRKV